MIVYPKNWRSVGQEVTIEEVRMKISCILAQLNCKSLTLSGGLDSSLLLYLMCIRFREVTAFTIGKSADHPDVVHAHKMVKYCTKNFKVKIKHHIYFPEYKRVPIYELLYNFVGNYTDEIISGDGVDEFMAGYYAHMDLPGERTYYEYLRRLRNDHLIPLDLDSGNVKVYLPYIDAEIVSLLSQIPLSQKADKSSRKKFMVEMARGNIPDMIIDRRKYGLCDALRIKREIK